MAREYDGNAEEPSVEEFLQQVALFSQQDELEDDEGVVTLTGRCRRPGRRPHSRHPAARRR